MESMKQDQSNKQDQLQNIKAGKFDGGRMWTFDDPPVEYFRDTYRINADTEWLERARLGALRFATWCSASFVSEDGLVMTNHHCSRTSLEKVQLEGEKLLETGFYAIVPGDERRVPDLFVEQLIQIHDVTSRVHEKMDAAENDAAKVKARNAILKEIKEQYTEGEDMRCQVISLYAGGKYSAYVFKRYDDVRLVFAPELAMGHFGGGDDNFTYPRYAIDCSFFRVYDEAGEPITAENYFKWSEKGAKEGEPVFVLGNPGSTNRLATVAKLEFMRDVYYPFIARLIDNRMDVLERYAGNNQERKDEVHTDILSMANGDKAYEGRLDGLNNDILMARRADFERNFRSAVEAKPELKEKYGFLWDQIAADRAKVREVAPVIYGLRMGGLGVSAYIASAYSAVKFVKERIKEGKEAEEVDEARVRSLARFIDTDDEKQLYTLEHQLEVMRDFLGENDPIVQRALQGKTPAKAAKDLLDQTIMKDSARFYLMVAGGMKGLEASNDAFIRLALMMHPRIEKAVAVYRDVQNRDQVNQGLLGRAQFEVYGTAIPPDATFSLRIADGVVKGFEYNGTKAPVFTTFYGMYDRHHSFPGDEGWYLPERWRNPPADFDMSTPCNFVSTCDIIGGNSGSPIVNKDLEVVGLVFDGNIESLPGDFIFAEDMNNRTVSVHSSGILEVVRSIYKAQRIANELKSGKMDK
jgi:Peptidase S46